MKEASLKFFANIETERQKLLFIMNKMPSPSLLFKDSISSCVGL